MADSARRSPPWLAVALVSLACGGLLTWAIEYRLVHRVSPESVEATDRAPPLPPQPPPMLELIAPPPSRAPGLAPLSDLRLDQLGTAAFGYLQISTIPPVHIYRGGSIVGQTISLNKAEGVITLGSGSDADRDPFSVDLVYRVTSDRISYALDSEPWAIVSRKGIGIGRTPIAHTELPKQVALELRNPKDSSRLRGCLL